MPNLQKSRVTPILDTTIWIENEGDIWQVFVQIDCECNGEGCGGNIGASPKIMGKQTPDLVADYTRVALIDALMTKKENVKNQSRSEANGLLRAVMSAIRDGEAEVVGVSRTKKEPVKH